MIPPFQSRELARTKPPNTVTAPRTSGAKMMLSHDTRNPDDGLIPRET